MDKATEVLRWEHRSIKDMLELMERFAEKMNRGQPVPPGVLNKTMEFIRLFVEQCHHGKEEEILFPLLERKNIPAAGGPLGVMLMEHDRARVFIHKLNIEAANDNAESARRWTRVAWNYSDLMFEHFHKEEEILFAMADRILTSEEQASAVRSFERLNVERIGPGRHQQIRTMMEELISQNR